MKITGVYYNLQLILVMLGFRFFIFIFPYISNCNCIFLAMFYSADVDVVFGIVIDIIMKFIMVDDYDICMQWGFFFFYGRLFTYG